jgi:hypothetical protein
MEKALIKYDGIEFSLPLAVTDNHNPTFNIFNRMAVFFVGEYFGKKEKIKKTSSLKFQVMIHTIFNLKQKTKL